MQGFCASSRQSERPKPRGPGRKPPRPGHKSKRNRETPRSSTPDQSSRASALVCTVATNPQNPCQEWESQQPPQRQARATPALPVQRHSSKHGAPEARASSSPSSSSSLAAFPPPVLPPAPALAPAALSVPNITPAPQAEPSSSAPRLQRLAPKKTRPLVKPVASIGGRQTLEAGLALAVVAPPPASRESLNRLQEDFHKVKQQCHLQAKHAHELENRSVPVRLRPDHVRKLFLRRVLGFTALHILLTMTLMASGRWPFDFADIYYQNPLGIVSILALSALVIIAFYQHCSVNLYLVSLAMVVGTACLGSIVLLHSDSLVVMWVCVVLEVLCVLCILFCCQLWVPYQFFAMLAFVTGCASVGYFWLIWRPYKLFLQEWTIYAWGERTAPPGLAGHFWIITAAFFLSVYVLWQLERLMHLHTLCDSHLASLKLFYNMAEIGFLCGLGVSALLGRINSARARLQTIYATEREAIIAGASL